MIALLVVTQLLAVDVQVDVTQDRHAISEQIYGVNFASPAQLERMGVTLHRFGGNATTRYNWQTSTSNRGSDYFFENIVEPGPGGESGADTFVRESLAAGASPLVTLTTIGWIAKTSPTSHPFACGFKVSRYGAQQSVDPWDTDCGNGVYAAGGNVSGNDPLDTSFAATPAWNTTWMQHLIATFGASDSGGVRYYSLDNEPGLWEHTHRDVHPAPVTYVEMRDTLYAYGAAAKAADPGATVIGPAAWGWTEYLFLTLGNGYGQYNTYGEFVPWYLDQARLYEEQHGVRILDALDLHFYPQVPGVALTGDSAALRERRLRSTRSLWDPTYQESDDGSWIDQPVQLIPRMRAWVQAHYPGTKLSISEYNWGLLDNPVAAIAQADVLGIFGREGLDMATLWAGPADDAIGEDAFKLFRNYDGSGARFGTTSVRASSSDADGVTAYAAQHGGGRVTVVLINKTATSQTVSLEVAAVESGGDFRAFRFGASGRLAASGAGTLAGGALERTLPAHSAELVEWNAPGATSGPEPENPSNGGAGGGGGGGTGPGAVRGGCASAPGTFLPAALLAWVGVLRRRRR